jgi:hypothetical protein
LKTQNIKATQAEPECLENWKALSTRKAAHKDGTPSVEDIFRSTLHWIKFFIHSRGWFQITWQPMQGQNRAVYMETVPTDQPLGSWATGCVMSPNRARNEVLHGTDRPCWLSTRLKLMSACAWFTRHMMSRESCNIAPSPVPDIVQWSIVRGHWSRFK